MHGPREEVCVCVGGGGGGGVTGGPDSHCKSQVL